MPTLQELKNSIDTRFKSNNKTLIAIFRTFFKQLIDAIEETSTSDDGLYKGSSPTTVQVGNWAPGTSVIGTTRDRILQEIIAPFNEPTFSSFTMSGQATLIEVGITIDGTKNFTFGFTYGDNVKDNTIEIIDVTNNNPLLEGGTKVSPKALNIGSIVKTAPSNHIWRIVAENINNNKFNRTLTINWGYRRYSGSMSSLPTTGNQIRTALLSSSVINTSDSFSFSSGTTNNIFVIAVVGKIITNVLNTTANENLTSGFILSSEITSTPDGGGNPVATRVYIMQNGSPFPSNQNLQVTLTNG